MMDNLDIKFAIQGISEETATVLSKEFEKIRTGAGEMFPDYHGDDEPITGYRNGV